MKQRRRTKIFTPSRKLNDKEEILREIKRIGTEVYSTDYVVLASYAREFKRYGSQFLLTKLLVPTRMADADARIHFAVYAYSGELKDAFDDETYFESLGWYYFDGNWDTVLKQLKQRYGEEFKEYDCDAYNKFEDEQMRRAIFDDRLWEWIPGVKDHDRDFY